MPLSDNPDVFQDVERAFRYALVNPNGAVQPMVGANPAAKRRKAVQWRQRAYHYRELMRKQTQAYAGTSKHGEVGKTQYDRLVLRITDDGDVKIESNDIDVVPVPIGLDGIEPPPMETPDNDVVGPAPVVDFSEALRLAADLGLDLGENK